MRYFEFTEGNSSKFWEVNTLDKGVFVRFGKIGTKGQTRIKGFADSESAINHAEKLIAEKTGKGYQEKEIFIVSEENMRPI